MSRVFEAIIEEARTGNVEGAARSLVALSKETIPYKQALADTQAIRKKYAGVRLRRQRERSRHQTQTASRTTVEGVLAHPPSGRTKVRVRARTLDPGETGSEGEA